MVDARNSPRAGAGTGTDPPPLTPPPVIPLPAIFAPAEEDCDVDSESNEGGDDARARGSFWSSVSSGVRISATSNAVSSCNKHHSHGLDYG